MLRGFFGNLIFAIVTRMLCGNHLKKNSTSIQHRFNTFQHAYGGKGVPNAFNIAIQQTRKDVEANVEAVY